jgi:hypothetical protein
MAIVNTVVMVIVNIAAAMVIFNFVVIM